MDGMAARQRRNVRHGGLFFHDVMCNLAGHLAVLFPPWYGTIFVLFCCVTNSPTTQWLVLLNLDVDKRDEVKRGRKNILIENAGWFHVVVFA